MDAFAIIGLYPLDIKLSHEIISRKDAKALFPINVFKFAKAYSSTDF